MDETYTFSIPETRIFANDGNEFALVHSLTLGDILLATLLAILIVTILLSRLLGRSSGW